MGRFDICALHYKIHIRPLLRVGDNTAREYSKDVSIIETTANRVGYRRPPTISCNGGL